MNKLSFLDELLIVGSFAPIVKCAFTDGTDASNAADNSSVVDAPAGLMSEGPTPPQITPIPDEAASRLPNSSAVHPAIKPGELGGVTDAAVPIDFKRFNRMFQTGDGR